MRFPKVLKKLLGSDFEVIEEGLNSRTLHSVYARPNKEGRRGSDYFVPCLDSHDPLEWVILLLGTTELKEEFDNTPEEIGGLLETYFVKVALTRKSQCGAKKRKVLIISPAVIDETTDYTKERYAGGTEKSKRLSAVYSKIAKKNKCGFVDASGLKVGKDGVHLTKESHAKLAKLVANKIKPRQKR